LFLILCIGLVSIASLCLFLSCWLPIQSTVGFIPRMYPNLCTLLFLSECWWDDVNRFFYPLKLKLNLYSSFPQQFNQSRFQNRTLKKLWSTNLLSTKKQTRRKNVKTEFHLLNKMTRYLKLILGKMEGLVFFRLKQKMSAISSSYLIWIFIYLEWLCGKAGKRMKFWKIITITISSIDSILFMYMFINILCSYEKLLRGVKKLKSQEETYRNQEILWQILNFIHN